MKHMIIAFILFGISTIFKELTNAKTIGEKIDIKANSTIFEEVIVAKTFGEKIKANESIITFEEAVLDLISRIEEVEEKNDDLEATIQVIRSALYFVSIESW